MWPVKELLQASPHSEAPQLLMQLFSSFSTLQKFPPVIISPPLPGAHMSSKPARPQWPSFQENLYHTESQSSHATKITVCPWSTAICSLSVSSFPARTQCPTRRAAGLGDKGETCPSFRKQSQSTMTSLCCDAPRCTANPTHQLLMLSKEIAFPATWEICQQNKWIQINSSRRRIAILIHGFLSSVLLKWSLSSTQAAVINTSSLSCTFDY